MTIHIAHTNYINNTKASLLIDDNSHGNDNEEHKIDNTNSTNTSSSSSTPQSLTSSSPPSFLTTPPIYPFVSPLPLLHLFDDLGLQLTKKRGKVIYKISQLMVQMKQLEAELAKLKQSDMTASSSSSSSSSLGPSPPPLPPSSLFNGALALYSTQSLKQSKNNALTTAAGSAVVGVNVTAEGMCIQHSLYICTSTMLLVPTYVPSFQY